LLWGLVVLAEVRLLVLALVLVAGEENTALAGLLLLNLPVKPLRWGLVE